MLTSVHLLTGAAIGKVTGNLWVAAIISFAFHHVLDFIPHYTPKPVKGYLQNGLRSAYKQDLILKSIEPAIGILVTLYLIFYNQQELRTSMIIGAFFGWLPDMLVLLDWKFKIGSNGFYRRIEKRFHHHATLLHGTWIQVLIVGLAIFILVK